jgi:cyclic beta-1,2-glucan synthetase
LAFFTALWLMRDNPPALAAAAPILLLWWMAPVVAYWISLPIPRRASRLTDDQTLFLHSLSRKTWLFFETWVGPDDNWLPIDNMQEQPVAVAAHRTSPTNIGLSLLANLAAYDFGYVAAGKLIERSQNTLRTMGAMARYQGHFYNWYDTQTRQPGGSPADAAPRPDRPARPAHREPARVRRHARHLQHPARHRGWRTAHATDPV